MSKQYLEVSTEKWAITVEVDACDKCYYSRGWWNKKLWQNPATGKVHATGENWDKSRTNCGLPLPAKTAQHRILTSVSKAS